MHIAICVWGIMRSLRYTIHSLHHFMLTPIQRSGNTYEIFMHTYNFTGIYESARNFEPASQLNFSDWKILKPDHILVEDQDEYDKYANYEQYMDMGDPWHNDYVSFRNHLRALHALQQLAIALEEASHQRQFDGVIYVRADVLLLNPVPFFLLKRPQTMFLPDFHRSCKGGEYNDRMALGDMDSALVYGRRIEHALEYSRRNPLHAEKFIYGHLTASNVTVLEVPLRFRRVRSSGDEHYRDSHVPSPDEQPEHVYRTPWVLRQIYGVIEATTGGYVWNHNDRDNVYCRPHSYLDTAKSTQLVEAPSGYHR
mmetsp:Transcript_14321/g.32159  ORF Transcript_14321/g.32159 Transcript_14321/m.32159 type:complete len:310 (+) Transcript_14321:193-1122(+)